MSVRRLLWIVIPVLLVIVLVGGGLVVWLLVQGQHAPVRLVVLGPDTQVRLLEDGGTARVLSSDASTNSYAYPTPTPDQHALAYVAVDANGVAIIKVDLASGERKELYRSSDNVPIDLAWSPDGKYLVFLLDGGRTIHIVLADGSATEQLVATGPPSFFSWSTDSAMLLMHLGGHSLQGGRIETYQTGASHASPVLNDPGFFQAPAWSIDGKHFFYAAQPAFNTTKPTRDDLVTKIVRATTDGRDPTVLIDEQLADLRIVRAPNSDQLAYMSGTFDEAGLPVFGALKLIDGAGGAARTLSHPGEHVTAFFWSPDGMRIAYLTHASDAGSTAPRSWHIVNIADGAVRDFDAFTPSTAFAGLQLFFDAYSFSFSPWSPAGDRLVYGAADGVYVLNVAEGRAARVADGALGVWVTGQ
jgi:Tol biopolymer transport system component